MRFVLVDVEPSELDAGKAALVLRADAGATAEALLAGLRGAAGGSGPLLPGAEQSGWAAALAGKAGTAREKLAARLAKTAFPLDYHTTLRVVRDEINRRPAPGPIVVAEGANTMDNARQAAAGRATGGGGRRKAEDCAGELRLHGRYECETCNAAWRPGKAVAAGADWA